MKPEVIVPVDRCPLCGGRNYAPHSLPTPNLYSEKLAELLDVDESRLLERHANWQCGDPDSIQRTTGAWQHGGTGDSSGTFHSFVVEQHKIYICRRRSNHSCPLVLLKDGNRIKKKKKQPINLKTFSFAFACFFLEKGTDGFKGGERQRHNKVIAHSVLWLLGMGSVSREYLEGRGGCR